MSSTIHDAIIVTSHRRDAGDAARAHALSLGLLATEVVVDTVNGWATFLIAPDGSKEGWPESDAAEEARRQWVAWAREQWTLAASPPYKGGAFLHFVHVRYGDTGGRVPEPELADWQPDRDSEH